MNILYAQVDDHRLPDKVKSAMEAKIVQTNQSLQVFFTVRWLKINFSSRGCAVLDVAVAVDIPFHCAAVLGHHSYCLEHQLTSYMCFPNQDMMVFINNSNVGDLLLKLLMCRLPEYQDGSAPLTPFWQTDPYHACK